MPECNSYDFTFSSLNVLAFICFSCIFPVLEVPGTVRAASLLTARRRLDAIYDSRKMKPISDLGSTSSYIFKQICTISLLKFSFGQIKKIYNKKGLALAKIDLEW